MMEHEQYCLKWNHHWANLIGVFNSLRQTETFVDVTLSCEGQSFKAHRLVLSACSPYFTQLLLDNPDRNPVVIIKGTKPEYIKHLLHFIYNGEVAIEEEKLPELVAVAREFKVQGLSDKNLKEEQLKSAAAKSLSKAEEDGDIDVTTTSGDGPPARILTGGAYALPVDIRKVSQPSTQIPTSSANEETHHNSDEPLSLVTSSDEPTDLTSNSKQKRETSKGENRSFSPESQSRKKRRLSDEVSVTVNGFNGMRHESPGPSLPTHSEDQPLALTVDISRHQRSPLSLTSSQRSPRGEEERRPSINLRTPDSMMKEEPLDYISTQLSASSSPVHSQPGLSVTSLPHSSPLLHPSPGVPHNRHQLALLQRALYPTVPYFPTPLDPQHGSMPPVNTQTKDLLQFLDLVKSFGSVDPSLGGSLGSTGLSAAFPHIPRIPGGTLSPSKDSGMEGDYTCHICARIMPTQQFLEEHIKIHEEEKPYKCDHCGQRYKYQSAFQRHQEQNHTAKLPGEKPYRCTVCGQCFKYHKSFLKHRSNHDALDHIMKNEQHDDSKGLHSSYIQSLLSSRLNLGLTASQPPERNHLKEEMVDVDDSSLERKNSIEQQNGDVKEEDEDYEDTPVRFLHCTRCKAMFKTSLEYDEHCRASNGECSQEFIKEITLPNDRGSSLSNPQSSSSSPPGSPHRSPVWGHSFNSRSPLGTATSSPQMTPPVNIMSPSSQSNVCTSLYTSLTNINFKSLHNSGGSPSVKIPPNLPPIMLSIGASGSDKGADSQGLVDEEKPFKCPYCTKGFKGRENLKLHIRTHTGEKPYNCGVCGKAFGGRSDMNRHLRIHTGEKPYPCKVCGKKFARADYLSKHITTHLGIPFAKPVHSLQQSLQNLENIQNVQSLSNVQSN